MPAPIANRVRQRRQVTMITVRIGLRSGSESGGTVQRFNRVEDGLGDLRVDCFSSLALGRAQQIHPEDKRGTQLCRSMSMSKSACAQILGPCLGTAWQWPQQRRSDPKAENQMDVENHQRSPVTALGDWTFHETILMLRRCCHVAP